jgi:hypothetical protein
MQTFENELCSERGLCGVFIFIAQSVAESISSCHYLLNKYPVNHLIFLCLTLGKWILCVFTHPYLYAMQDNVVYWE